MGETIKVIADRADDESVTVVPQETNAPELRVENPPGVLGLKLLHLMHAEAGVSLAEDIEHRLPQAEVRRLAGIRNLSRREIRRVLKEIVALQISYERFDADGHGEVRIGVMVQEAQARIDAGGVAEIAWRFGSLFRACAAWSDRWALIDRSTLFRMRSRYAIALFEHLSGLSWRTYRSERLEVEELRRVLGVPEGRLRSFADLRVRALDPAVREITELSRFDVDYELRRSGRRGGPIAGITLRWDLKQEVKPAQSELELPPPANTGNRTRFPRDGRVRWDDYWEPLARDHGQGRDVDRLGENFVGFCERRGIPLDAKTITRAFIGFCRAQDPV